MTGPGHGTPQTTPRATGRSRRPSCARGNGGPGQDLGRLARVRAGKDSGDVGAGAGRAVALGLMVWLQEPGTRGPGGRQPHRAPAHMHACASDWARPPLPIGAPTLVGSGGQLTSSSRQGAPCSHGWHGTAGTRGSASGYRRSPVRAGISVRPGTHATRGSPWVPPGQRRGRVGCLPPHGSEAAFCWSGGPHDSHSCSGPSPGCSGSRGAPSES